MVEAGRYLYTRFMAFKDSDVWRLVGNNFVRIGLGLLAILLIANLIRSIQVNYGVSRQIRTLNAEISSEHDQAAIDKEQNDYYQTNTYRELEARRLLGYAAANETLVLVPQNQDATSTTSPSGRTAAAINEAKQHWDALPPYQQWWQLFFGPTTLLEQTFGS